MLILISRKKKNTLLWICNLCNKLCCKTLKSHLNGDFLFQSYFLKTSQYFGIKSGFACSKK